MKTQQKEPLKLQRPAEQNTNMSIRSNIKKKLFKRIGITVILIISIVFIAAESNLLRLDFSGFNGLYISKSEDFQTVNWITTISDSGFYFD